MESVQRDSYGNIIDGTAIPPVTHCETERLCIECACYRKCLAAGTLRRVAGA